MDPAKYETFVMADKDEFLAMKTGRLDAYLTCDPWASMARITSYNVCYTKLLR